MGDVTDAVRYPITGKVARKFLLNDHVLERSDPGRDADPVPVFCRIVFLLWRAWVLACLYVSTVVEGYNKLIKYPSEKIIYKLALFRPH